MAELVLSRTRASTGEILDRIPLDEWLSAAHEIDGFELTNSFPTQNLFTREEITVPQEGAGRWTFDGTTHVVRYKCGAVVVDNYSPRMVSALGALATRLSAWIQEKGPPVFAAERLSLPDLLRRAIHSSLDRIDAFSEHADYAIDTPCVAIEASLPLDEVRAIARALGYPHPLAPDDVLEQVAHSAAHLRNPPSDRLLVEAFAHYMRNDAFLEVALDD